MGSNPILSAYSHIFSYKVRSTDSDKFNYINALFGQQSEDLKKVRDTFVDLSLQISPYEGALISFIASLIRPKKILEIGTLGGYSTLWLAKSLAQGGKIYSIEKDLKRFQVAQKNLQDWQDRIVLLNGDAHEVLASILSSDFDLLFIDADKGGYCKYLDWAEKHLCPGGIIIADNTLLFDTVYCSHPQAGCSKVSWQVMQDFNQRLSDPNKYQTVFIPTEAGMLVARKLF